MPVFYGAIDLSKNELRNAVVQNLASAPGSPGKGQVYFDTSTNVLYWWNGSQWIAAQAAAGAIPAATVTTQAVGDAPVVGTMTTYAREDHKHGREAFGAAIDTSTGYGLAAANGSAATVARSDHSHGTPFLSGVAPTGADRPGAVASAGTALLPSRYDHVHPFGVALANMDMGGFKVVNVADPTVTTDAATKNYVDNLVAGMTWKNPVRVVGTTQSGTTGTAVTIDGVSTFAVGDRVLLAGQSIASGNGIWIVQAGAWTRAPDADASAELVSAAVYVSEGTTYADTAWVCTNNAPITIGTTGINFVQFAGGGAVTAGAGMTQAGNVLNVIAGDTSLVVNADELHVNTGVIATVASVPPNARQVIAGAGLTGGGDLSADRTLNVIAADGSIVVTADAISRGALSGDVSAAAGSNTTAIGAGVVTNAQLANMAANLIKGRVGSTGAPQDLSPAQVTAMLTIFSNFTPGLVPGAPGGANTQFLRADATWQAIPVGVAKFAAALTGTASPEVVTHNLNTRDIQLTVLNGASPYTAVEVDWDATTVNTATIRYNPNLGAGYRVVVVG